MDSSEQHKGLDLLELCHTTRGWGYVIGRDQDYWRVVLNDHVGRGATLHEAAAQALDVALRAIGEK